MSLIKRAVANARGEDVEVGKALSPAVAQAAAQSQASSGATYAPAQNPSNPFNQSGGYGSAFNPLPRPYGEFDSGFGPGFPLIPDPLDPLTSDGRSLTRRTQYLISTNLNLIDRRLPWSVLRGLAEECDVIARCIQLVQDSLVGLEWSWGFSKQILQQIMDESDITNSAKAVALAREKYGAELTRVQEFFDYPDRRMGFTFSQWLTDMIYSHLVYDGIVVSPQYNLGGDLISLSTIDTATIKILLDNQGFIPQPPAPAYQQILYGFPRGEYQAENAEHDGTIPNGFQQDQLSYYIRRPHPSSMYGYSQVEECINIATIYLQRQAWMHAEWSNGVMPKLFIETAGTETWTPEQMAYYETVMNDRLSGQTARRQNMFLLRPGMTPHQMEMLEQTYKADYDEWLVLQMGAKFGVPQSMLGVQMRSSIGGNANKNQGDQSEQFATAALKNFLIDCINDMARRFMDIGPELTMTCTGGGDDDDDLQRAQADASDVGAGIRTRNEIRAERGIPIMDEPEADQLAITTGTGVAFLAGALAAQQQQQSAASVAAANGQMAGGPTNGTSPNTGRQPSNGGTGSTPGQGSGDNGPAKTSGSSSATSSTDSKPAAKPTTSAKPKPDSPAQKELAAFAKFIKSRETKGIVRDFEFSDVDERLGGFLNDAARDGDLELIKETLDLLKGREDTPSDVADTDRLKEYWVTGKGGQEIRWGVDGDFDRCRALVAGKVPAQDIDGYCASRHHDATGAWPGHAPGESKKATASEKGRTIAGGKVLNDLHDRIVDFYAPKIAEAMSDVDGLEAAIEAARKGAATKGILAKVGPKGYIHGWIFVGAPGLGDSVNHPSLGKGTVTGVNNTHVTAKFGDAEHSFERGTPSSHGGHSFEERGNGDDHVAGQQWSASDFKELSKQDASDLARARLMGAHDYPEPVLAKLIGRDEDKWKAQYALPNGAVIRVHKDMPDIPAEKMQTIKETVAQLQSAYPDDPHTINLTTSTGGLGGGVYGYAVPGYPTLSITAGGIRAKQASQDASSERGYSAKAGFGVDPTRYTIVHEWGHTIDTDPFQKRPEVDKALRGQREHKTGYALSKPKVQRQESYAEAYTEWVLSKGKTDNPMVQKLATVENWKF